MQDEEQTYLEFPPTLNSYERRLAHIFAQEQNLNTKSMGEGRERYLTISKK